MIQTEARPYTTTGVAKELGSRISSLLGIPVVKTYGLSSYVCRDCSKSHHCCCTEFSDFAQLLMITSDDVLETEDARTEYGLPKIWVKLAHAYTADTRLSASSPPRALLESLGTRLGRGGTYNRAKVCWRSLCIQENCSNA